MTFVVLVLELTSTRLFAYVGGANATSTALSIALLGLGLGAFVRVRIPRATRGAAPGLAAALFGLAVAVFEGAPLVGLVAISCLPFAFAGILISDAYVARGREVARTTYAIDLTAAACACLLAPHLLGPLSPVEIIAMLGVIASALAPRRWALIAIVHVGVLVASRAGGLPDGPLDALLRSDLRDEKAMLGQGDILDSAWSPVGRLDVTRAPGDDARLGVFTDGMSPTFMVPAGDTSFEDTWGLLMSLPYRALHPDRVLVLGAGAGASVWLAEKYGATRIDAVEINPAITELLARWKSFAGDVYHQPGAHLFIDDARRYLSGTSDRYDLIELALALTGNGQAQPAGMEANLYTVEAARLFLRHLTPHGVLVLVHSDPGNAYRQLLTVLAALESLGFDRDSALDRIAVLRDPRPETAYQYLLVVGTAPLPLDVVDQLYVDPAELLWGPGDGPEEAAQLLDRTQLGATELDDLSPVHDDRPYFFQNTRGLFATAMAQPGRMIVLAVALLLVIVLIVEGRVGARPGAVASGAGAAFLCVELSLIQRLTVAAGGMLYAISFVLFAVLAWSAVGALLLGDRWRRLDRGVGWACLPAGLAVAGTAWLVRDLAWLEGISSDALRLALVGALLAPVGIAIGGPFPTLLAQQGEPARRLASLWAVNGVASVAGGIVAVLALRVAGATHALDLAAATYFAMALVAPRRRHDFA